MQRKILILILIVLAMITGRNIAPTESAPPGNAPIAVKNTEEIPLPKYELFPVVRIIDGDTIVVEINGIEEKVRLIGVDTPESLDSRKKVECFGKEASLFTTNLLENTSVYLEDDSTQNDRDKYGRLLRYVFLSNGTFINETLIAEGYGHEYTYRTHYNYRDEFKVAEETALHNRKGLWASNACGK